MNLLESFVLLWQKSNFCKMEDQTKDQGICDLKEESQLRDIPL